MQRSQTAAWFHTVFVAVVMVTASVISAHAAGNMANGPVSGLPVPRFVSLKPDKVNVRGGPTRDHDVTWTYTRAGLPVEITAESDNWRRIRDCDGAEGWVYHSMLSGRRTAVVTAKGKDELVPLLRQRRSQSGGGRAPAVRRGRRGEDLHRHLVPHHRLRLRRLDRAGAALGRLSGREGGVGFAE